MFGLVSLVHVLEVVGHFISVFLGFISSGWRGFMSLKTTRVHITANIVLTFFVGSFQGYILGWRCGLTSLAITDALSELEKRYWRVRLAEAWAPRHTQTRHSPSSPCECLVLCRTARRNASPYSALHWNHDPTFVRIVWNRYASNLSGWLIGFSPNRFSAAVSSSTYWSPLLWCLTCLRKEVSFFVVSIFSRTHETTV